MDVEVSENLADLGRRLRLAPCRRRMVGGLGRPLAPVVADPVPPPPGLRACCAHPRDRSRLRPLDPLPQGPLRRDDHRRPVAGVHRPLPRAIRGRRPLRVATSTTESRSRWSRTARSTCAFSFDSLVHVEHDVIEAYLPQLASKLTPDGIGFVHHSNMGAYGPPEWETRNQHWRGLGVSAQTFAATAHIHGLRCVSQEMLTWGDDTAAERLHLHLHEGGVRLGTAQRGRPRTRASRASRWRTPRGCLSCTRRRAATCASARASPCRCRPSRSRAPTGTPPAAPRSGRPASSASCLPSASRAACACA